MFVNEKVCEIALIISGSTDNELFADNFIELSKSSRENLLLSWDTFVYIIAREW